MRSRAGGLGRIGWLLAVVSLGAAPLPAAIAAEDDPTPITRPADLWTLTPEQKEQVHPLRIEGRVDYFDPLWKLLWLGGEAGGSFVQVSSDLPALAVGQRVRIEGTIVPDRGLEAARVHVTVLREHDPVTPLPTAGRINDLDALDRQVVVAEGYVDAQQLVDPTHLRLNLIVEDRIVIGWVRPDHPGGPLPAWQGHFVRITGLYSGKFDPTHTRTAIEIWSAHESDVTVTGALAGSPEFDRPRVPIGRLYAQPADAVVRVRGRVESQDNGRYVVLRDDSGMVRVTSLQHLRVANDAEVEAVGRVVSGGSYWIVDGAWFRPAAPVAGEAEPVEPDNGTLRSIEQVRRLDVDEAARGRRVAVAGVVTWSLPESDFFFLQNPGAGVRVHFDRTKFQAPSLNKALLVEGVTTRGDFAPGIEMTRFTDRGAMNPPEPRTITLEDALTGRWDGQYVLMSGFLQRIDSEGDWRWLHLTTPAGDFVGHLQSPVTFVANPGSLVQVRGVCETTADAGGHATGVTLRIAFIHDIAAEEDAPAELFDLPLRSLRTVDRLGGGSGFSRVRVAGVVSAVLPDGKLYLQDETSGLLLLGPQLPPLQPGDRIEAVGIVGREGLRPLLREVQCRRLGSGPAPAPLVLERPGRLAPLLDSRQVRVRGTLIDQLVRADGMRLTLQADGTVFEATLPAAGRTALPALGAGLELTGIYRLVYDDIRQSRGFELELGGAKDMTVFRRARFWTLERALLVCGVLAGAVLLFVAWITALRRRVHRQTAQIRQQLEREAELEAEVQRAARLESLGTLAGGIAHDFNNLLTVILGNATLAMSDRQAMHAAGDSLREIERGARRARELTQQLLTFAKGGVPHRVEASLPELLHREIDPLVRGTGVQVDYDLPAGLPALPLDVDQIGRALRALALNAVQAMPAGGRLRVVAGCEALADGDRPGLAAGDYVRLTLADSGAGISAEAMPRIFDPYFTTKAAGAGLGLATAYSVVRKHEGRIEAESLPGQGATFHLWLPVRAAPPAAAAAPAPVASPPAAPAKPRPRVLVMDDEESILRVIEIVLQRLGVDPIVVPDGQAALTAFAAAEAEGRPVDLLILDLTIPGGIGGRQVIEVIRRTAPSVPAIVSSGYSDDPVMARYRDFGFQAVVQKPYDVSQLAAMVSRFVGEAAAPKA